MDNAELSRIMHRKHRTPRRETASTEMVRGDAVQAMRLSKRIAKLSTSMAASFRDVAAGKEVVEAADTDFYAILVSLDEINELANPMPSGQNVDFGV